MVYMPYSDNGVELCHPVNDDDHDVIEALVDGTPRASTWKPLRMRIIREDMGRKLKATDCPSLGLHALIFRRRAVDALRPILLKDGELLPLLCEGEDLHLLNVTRVLPALDEAASTLERFDDGSIMMIDDYVFREDVVGKSALFKLSGLRASPTFVTDRFVDAWRSAGLNGFAFKQLWTS